MRQTTRSGASFVMIGNPARAAYARLDPREFELLALMDGTRSIEDLVIAYYQRHGTLAVARVASLVDLLRTQGFLQLQPATRTPDAYAALELHLRQPRKRSPSAGWRAQLIESLPQAPGWLRRLAWLPRGLRRGELRWEGFDAWLGAAYTSWGRLFFSTPWLVAGIGLGLLMCVLTSVELGRGRYSLYGVGTPLLSVVLLALVASVALGIHELGHGLATKHAGRHVRRAGVRLDWWLPAAYVDTTDVWLAPPRQRLLTAFAGPWTGLVLGGLCAIGAVVLPTGPVGAFLFTASCVFLIGSLFNFNPLLELDGYYLLVDLLEVPLLRPRALSFVLGPFWRKLWRRQRLSAQERLFALFGLGAILYSALAIVLAVRAWQALLLPAIVAGLASPQAPPRLGALLLICVLAVPLGVWAWAALRRVLPPLALGVGWLRARAEFARHREALAALRAVPFLAGLPAARVLELARAAHLYDVKAGTEVVQQGELGHHFYVIVSGVFEVLVDGQPRLCLARGEYFGERALLEGEGTPRAATVVAACDSRLLRVGQAAFSALLANDLAAHARISRALVYRAEVAAMPLFANLAPAELDLLISRLAPERVTAGQVIIQEGDVGQRFYVIRRGRVQVTRNGAVLAELGAGEAFGEIALLLDVPRTATVTATQPTHLLVLDAPDFRDLLATYLGRAAELQRLSQVRLRAGRHLDAGM